MLQSLLQQYQSRYSTWNSVSVCSAFLSMYFKLALSLVLFHINKALFTWKRSCFLLLLVCLLYPYWFCFYLYCSFFPYNISFLLLLIFYYIIVLFLGCWIRVFIGLFNRWKHQWWICLGFLNWIFFQLDHRCYLLRLMPFSTYIFWFFFFWLHFHGSEVIYFPPPPPLFRFFLWNSLCDLFLISPPTPLLWNIWASSIESRTWRRESMAKPSCRLSWGPRFALTSEIPADVLYWTPFHPSWHEFNSSGLRLTPPT